MQIQQLKAEKASIEQQKLLLNEKLKELKNQVLTEEQSVASWDEKIKVCGCVCVCVCCGFCLIIFQAQNQEIALVQASIQETYATAAELQRSSALAKSSLQEHNVSAQQLRNLVAQYRARAEQLASASGIFLLLSVFVSLLLSQ